MKMKEIITLLALAATVLMEAVTGQQVLGKVVSSRLAEQSSGGNEWTIVTIIVVSVIVILGALSSAFLVKKMRMST